MCEETIRNTEGRLNIINPEDFDNCGIEIFVKFKIRRSSLFLTFRWRKIYGGNSLYNAIFMYKPSPFTFLDEIEAALDEKNTKNLLGKLRDLQISHNLS